MVNLSSAGAQPLSSTISMISLHQWTEFAARAYASKISNIKYDFKIIDCQVSSNHLLSMGAENISRDLFLEIIKDNVNQLAKTTFE